MNARFLSFSALELMSSILPWFKVDTGQKHSYAEICLSGNQQEPRANSLFHVKPMTNGLVGRYARVSVCVWRHSAFLLFLGQSWRMNLTDESIWEK